MRIFIDFSKKTKIFKPFILLYIFFFKKKFSLKQGRSQWGKYILISSDRIQYVTILTKIKIIGYSTGLKLFGKFQMNLNFKFLVIILMKYSN